MERAHLQALTRRHLGSYTGRPMIIRIDDCTVMVEEADDFRQLHVVTRLNSSQAGRALRQTGTGRLTEDGSAALGIRIVHDRAAEAGSAEDWEAQWRAMISNAAKNGWISADRRYMYAHIETIP